MNVNKTFVRPTLKITVAYLIGSFRRPKFLRLGAPVSFDILLQDNRRQLPKHRRSGGRSITLSDIPLWASAPVQRFTVGHPPDG